MSKLRIISLIIFVLIGLTSLITHPCVASPELPKASISITSPTLYGWSIPYGQKIAFKVRVCVDKDSPVPLEDYWIQVAIYDPNGKCTYKDFHKMYKINPGQCHEFILKDDKFVANKIGTWKYLVRLYVYINLKWYLLDEVKGTFEVYGIPKAEVDIRDIGYNYKVELGQKITCKVRVYVDTGSSVPLDGFRLSISIQKPDGKQVSTEITKDDKINPGFYKDYTFELDQVADKVGTWKCKVTLYTKDKQHKLDEKSHSFVVYGIPKAKIEVLDIFGYAATASMICAGLALALSRIVR